MKFVPFLVGMNKVYLTTQKYAPLYMDHFARADAGVTILEMTKFRIYNTYLFPIRFTELFGANVLSYSPDSFGLSYRVNRSIKRKLNRTRNSLSETKAWLHLRNTGLGNLIRRLADRLLSL